MVRASKLLERMRENPAGWRIEEVERALAEYDFAFRNQRGSDRIYKHEASGVRVFVSWHGAGEVKRGYVRRVVRAIDQTRRSE